MKHREALPELPYAKSYFGNVFGAVTCCQPSPFSDFNKATTSCCSCSVSSRGMIVLFWCGFLYSPGYKTSPRLPAF